MENQDFAMTTAFRMASNIAWGITSEYLAIIEDVVNGKTTPQMAVAGRTGARLQDTRMVENRQGVAVIPVDGVIFRYASLFSDLSGNAASVQTIAKDFTTALGDPSIKAIVFNFGTAPGGEVAGIAELASMIYAARDVKPIIAYVGDLCGSAAYWLAVACKEIVAARMARVGSIGILAIANMSGGSTSKTFTSRQSPKKVVPLNTSAGDTIVQQEIDMAGGMFVNDVATMRGVTEDTVLEDFGQGGIMYADAAQKVGMIDRIGTYEALITELQQGGVNASAKAVVDGAVFGAFSSAVSAITPDNTIKVRKITI